MKKPFENKPLLRMLARAALVLSLFVVVVLAGCGGGDNTPIAAPTITTQPATQTVAVNAPIILTVTATGTNLRYQWFKDGFAIPGATAGTFNISNAAFTDIGAYYAVVSNSAGSVTSVTINLNVASSTGSATVTVN